VINSLLKARRIVLAAFACLLIFFAAGTQRLTIDPNNRVFFGPDHRHFVALKDLEDKFGSNTSIVFLIVSHLSLDEDAELPDAIRWLSKEVWSIASVAAVSSIATYPNVSVDGDELHIEDLLDHVCPVEGSSCNEERLGELEKSHLKYRLVGTDLRSFAVIADINLDSPSGDIVTRSARDAERVRAVFSDRYPNLSIYVTGGVPMMQAFFDAAQADSERLILLAVLVLSLGLYIFLGGIVPTLFMLLLGGASVTVSMGLAGWTGLVINTATATVPLVVFTLVIAAAMHVFLHIVREERPMFEEDVQRAVRTSVAANWRPVLLTAATTAVGLLSMTFVSAPPLREVGLLSAVGVMAGAILSLTVIPCLFSYVTRIEASKYLLKLQELMNRYAKWLERTRPRMFAVWLFFGLCLAGLVKVTIDEDFVRYFASDTSFRKDTEIITRLMAGPYHVDLVYDSQESAGIYLPRSVKDLKMLKEHLVSDGRVVNVGSILDVLSEMDSLMSRSGRLDERTPEELAEYFLSYELSLSAGQSAHGLLDADHRRARVAVQLADVSMKDIRQLDRGIREWLALNKLDDRIIVTGEGIPTAYLSSESIREIASGIVVSIFLSTLLVGLYFRNLRAAGLIFGATLVPILAGFGVWGWFGSDIGMAATMVIAVTLGVVVDDTIHLTYRYVDSVRNLDLTAWGAIAYSVHKTGTAIVVTSIAIVGGLMMLLGSEFRMNSTFGICSSMVIALALFYNLSIAPVMLRYLK
jgi:uncharacterized protein